MKVLLGLSGGVDSAYCATLLKSRGYDVVGCVLRMHEHTDIDGATRCAKELSIPIVTLDCTREFDSIIKTNFVNEYMHGRTPNPCILCNERVKFEFLYRYATEQGFDFIATGHYAHVDRIETEGSVRYAISSADDSSKDQSYMLYRLPQYVLSKLLLPIGDYKKENVRTSADSTGLSAANKRDSQEICFLPDGKHYEYIENVYGKAEKGSFIDPDGNVLGMHQGIYRYTVGQRKGLGISLGKRMFVINIDPENNTVTLSENLTGKTDIKISSIVYSGIAPMVVGDTVKASCKIRYQAPRLPVTCRINDDGTATLSFEKAVNSAPGQSAVLYIGDRVIMGGIIVS